MELNPQQFPAELQMDSQMPALKKALKKVLLYNFPQIQQHRNFPTQPQQ